MAIDKKKELDQMIEIYLKQLKDRLTGTRPRKPHTVLSYICSARNFLQFTGKTEQINSNDVIKYIAYLRSQGLQEVTLQSKMKQIKMLVQTCEFFEWKFTRADMPAPGQDYEAVTPTFTPEQLETLIRAQEKYSEAERFYLAVSTTFGCRREALCQITARQLNIEEGTIIIPGVHKGRTIKHLIPPVLKGVFAAYHPKHHSGQALTLMFHRIAQAAGIELPKAKTVQGFGWHGIRRCMDSMAEHFIPKCKDPGGKDPLPQSVWADFTGWSKIQKGRVFLGSPMAGHYSHFEVLYKDPYWMDRCIYAGHPLLKVWTEVLRSKKKK